MLGNKPGRDDTFIKREFNVHLHSISNNGYQFSTSTRCRSFILRDMTVTHGIATVNRRLRSLFRQPWVANGRIGDVIGRLWLRIVGVCQDFFTLRFVMRDIRKMYRRIRYFLILTGVINQRIRDGFKRVWIRSKPYEEKVKDPPKRRVSPKAEC